MKIKKLDDLKDERAFDIASKYKIHPSQIYDLYQGIPDNKNTIAANAIVLFELTKSRSIELIAGQTYLSFANKWKIPVSKIYSEIRRESPIDKIDSYATSLMRYL